MIWDQSIPAKWSILIWRVLRRRLLIDDILQHNGVQLALRCGCCIMHQQESISPLFITSKVAKEVWVSFSLRPCIPNICSSLNLMLNEWWIQKLNSPCHHLILHFIPLCICWELWCLRNAAKLEGRLLPTFFIIKRIEENIAAVFNGNAILLKRKQPDFWWMKPTLGRVKLNTDGCSKGNSRLSDGGSVLRNSDGGFIRAFAVGFGINSNMVAEAQALLVGIVRCIATGFLQTDIESDSLVPIQVLKNQVEPPWRIWYLVKRIKQLLELLDYGLFHTFRESNMVSVPHHMRGLLNYI